MMDTTKQETARETAYTLVLASASPRRQKLLAQIGVQFTAQASAFDEDTIPTSLAPREYVQRLAREKALCVAQTLDARSKTVVLGADTTVVVDGAILNKPTDAADAAQMLTRLSNRTHEVFTGIALVVLGDGKSGENNGENDSEQENNTGANNKNAQLRVITDVCRTEVRFRALGADEIRAYVASGSPMDKAGSYGIQDDFGAVFVSEIHGCYYNVVGLPLSMLYAHLQSIF